MFLALVLLAGCQGDRWSSVIDQPTPEGRWRPDGVLIRSYNVTLDEAADAVLSLARDKRWLVITESREDRSATARIKTRELVEIYFGVWAPAGRRSASSTPAATAPEPSAPSTTWSACCRASGLR
jgi:hypothetical protein